jgi:AbrB family transcriptional regulator (stage V sporulation protein T)
MKATGIVRRIDDLGRIVVPKEIRRTLRIREGAPLEIYTDKDGEIVLKKYSPMGDVSEYARGFAETLASVLQKTAVVTDTDTVIAAGGPERRGYMGKGLSQRLMEKIAQQKEPTEPVPVFEGEDMAQVKSQLVKLIVCDGMTIGSVILISGDRPTSESDEKCSRIAAGFISAQIGESI